VKLSKTHGFTLLELIVAVAVTGLLSGMLLTISSQVLNTQSKSSGQLETNLIAQSVLDQIQEDMQCALFRNDGNIWMALSILEDEENSGFWASAVQKKPPESSLRIFKSDTTESENMNEPEVPDNLGQLPFELSRFGVGGVWMRFFTQAPELGNNEEINSGGARAIAYQIIRYGLTASKSSAPRYQLFRTDVTAKNTYAAGYDLHPDGPYGDKSGEVNIVEPDTPRNHTLLEKPILESGDDQPATAFSIGSNIIDLGVRAYLVEYSSSGTGNLIQIFPPISPASPGNMISNVFYATSNLSLDYSPNPPPYNKFPDVVDIMVRVLTLEGANKLEAFESGDIPETDSVNWWSIAEENSDVYFRRVKIYGSGI
jgi:prepilin-type N-terminal cleavage/methylation domain-containing protein